MRRHRKNIWQCRSLSLSLSSVLGALILLAAAAVLSLFGLFFLSDTRLLRAISYIPVIMGAYTGAFICGKHRRRRGLIEGALCGTLIYVLVSAAAFIFTGETAGFGKFVLLVLSGSIGGIVGVNSKRPKGLKI